MIQEFARFVDRELSEEIAQRVTDLSNGVRSWEEYKHLTGLIRGLRLAQDRINDLAKRANQDE